MLKNIELVDCKVLWTQAFLSYFLAVSPKVEYIRIRGFFTTSPEPIDIRPLLGCVHLRSLEISQLRVSVESALDLAQLPYLETLSLSFIRHPASQSPLPHHLNPYIFHRVKSLECTSSPEFLQAGRFPALQSITLKDGFRIRESLNALWKHCSPEILSSFMIDWNSSSDSNLTLEDIRKVFSFRSLERFDIRTPRCIWDDHALETIASACSGLRDLVIYATNSVDEDPDGFTLHGLIHLAKYCPQLRSLCLTIRFRTPPVSLSDIPGDVPSNVHIESIYLSETDIESSQCDTVAAFLSRLFPKLRHVDLPFYTESWASWKRVDELLEKLGAE